MRGRTIVGRYQLERPLGKGAVGSVWRAKHLSLGMPVAVKLIDAQAARSAEALGRFEREARVAAQIRSAHVVRVLDHGRDSEAGDLPFIVMEYLEGESLRSRLAAQRHLPAATTARLVSHVCRAMSQAHKLGLVHRDLKPENIFLAREDDDEIVKVLDFGVAKAPDLLATTGMDPTRTGALIGTPYYMSPEQAQGLKSVDFRSDLWSLGVLTFECLTGQRPFVAHALGPLVAKIVAGAIPVPSHTAPDVGIAPEIDAWMARALAREPADRFQSAKEMGQELLIAAGTMDTLGHE